VDGKTCLFEIIIGNYIYTMLLQALHARKELQRLKQKAKELSIKPVSDSRMNHLEERGNDTIRTMKKQLDSDSEVKCAIVQVYDNSYNSQSDRWIGLKCYVESPNMLSYLEQG